MCIIILLYYVKDTLVEYVGDDRIRFESAQSVQDGDGPALQMTPMNGNNHNYNRSLSIRLLRKVSKNCSLTIEHQKAHVYRLDDLRE